MSEAEEIKDIIAKIEKFTDAPPTNIDNSTRIRLRETSRNLSIAMKIPGDTVHRIGNTVRVLAEKYYMKRLC
jgi:hypothetical protein